MEINKNPCGHWMSVAEERVAPHLPLPKSTAGASFRKKRGSGERSSSHSSSMHICEAKTIHTLIQTKSDIYSSKLRTAFRRKQINGAK